MNPDPSNQSLPRYDISQPYRWNYDNAPPPSELAVPAWNEAATFAGLSAPSPLGIAAGPLLNGSWVLYYASLGFDVLTYKTVRSRSRECYGLPNLVYVPDEQRTGRLPDVIAGRVPTSSWAVSFGMPSMSPDVWRSDIRQTRDQLSSDKLLNVSVVGTVQTGWSIEQLAEDYSTCARWAVDAGADTIEANLSCPNVSTCDGQLYQRPADAGQVCRAIRQAIGNEVPLLLKIGFLADNVTLARELLEAVAPYATTIVTTNSVPARVFDHHHRYLFEGQMRGICGLATIDASCQQVKMLVDLIRIDAFDLTVIGVGGIGSADHVRRYLEAGAEAVQIATAAMLDPRVAIRIKSESGKKT